MKFLKAAAVAVALIAGTASVNAATIEFVPPNDQVGRVFQTNSNDGWSNGRGIGFSVSSSQVINSVGLFHDLTNIDLSFGIYEISSATGPFTRSAALRFGSAVRNTTGLEWIDFSFTDLVLNVGTNYLIEFSFNGSANQNFFYNNNNAAWTQGGYTALDGTQGTGFGNSVVAAFRVGDEGSAVIPAPAALPLMVSGFAILGFLGRRRKS